MCIAIRSKIFAFSAVAGGALLTLASGGCSSPAGEGASTGGAAAVTTQVSGVTLKTQLQGWFVGAENNGGGAVIATAPVARAWETFTLIDKSGGALVSGDEVYIQSGGGQYFQAQGGGGGNLNAASANQLDWETFRIVKASGRGVIATGDVVGLQTITTGNWVSAQNGGGGPVFAYGAALGLWERFIIHVGNGRGGGVDSGAGTPAGTTHVVAYLPNYRGSFGDSAKKIDFAKMTHLNLAFATANGNNDWDMGASDQDVKALVDAAHGAGTKVLVSLGGGGGDQSVIAQYKNSGNIGPLVDKLDAFVAAHNFDGADVDIEDPNNLGANYSLFVSAMVNKLRPEGKLVTAAVAQYLQDSMSDATLHQFDFVNIMVYTNYADSVSALDYYSATKGVPKTRLTLGAGFFGTDSSGNEYAYSDIIAADGNAWSKDQAQVRGRTVNYTGMASMRQIAEYSKGFGGIMFWELGEDTTDAHSLYKVIQSTM